jgi:hypothetical protein
VARLARRVRVSAPSPWIERWAHLIAPGGGVLLYETFAVGNETVGRPKRADFLLAHGELLAVCAGLRIVAYEDGFLADPERVVQRIAAVREQSGEPAARYRLEPGRDDGRR